MIFETCRRSLEGRLENPSPEWCEERLAELGLSAEIFHKALDMAAADARSCTDYDAPSMSGVTFWSRTNRYIAEELTPTKWNYTRRDSILRTIHPSGSHAVTAISAAGKVGDLAAEVRTKNPKGAKIARLVEHNDQALFSKDVALWGKELDEIPTWFLLCKRRQKGPIAAELSLPVKMEGKFVSKWHERIPIYLPGGDSGIDIRLLDTPPDPSSGNGAPQVNIELLGGID